MISFDTYIDTIQSAKRQWVKTFVTNTHVAEAMNKFIDSQAEYTKHATKATTDMVTTIAKETTKTMQDSMKFDYAKFGEGIMKAYSNLGKS